MGTSTTPPESGQITNHTGSPGGPGQLRAAIDNYISPPGGGTMDRMHVPGHKGGPGAPPFLRARWGDAVFSDDLTEVPGLDDLSSPSGPIAESQRAVARAFGAREAFYLVQGTTGGLVALLLAAARCPGAVSFIAPRYCHRALVSAAILAGLQPVFCRGRFDDGLPAGPDLDHLRQLLTNRPPGVAAVVDTYPSIYGTAHELGAVAEIAHSAGLPLLVDGAHAALFGLSLEMPAAPLALGADAVVLSAHKGLGSLGQSSLLLLNDSEWAPGPASIASALRLTTTTSPSYPMLLSLEAAVCHRFGPAGRSELEAALDIARELRLRLDATGIGVLEPRAAGVAVDPLRLSVDAWSVGFTGLELAAWLREQANVQVEAADWRSVLVILGPGDTPSTGVRLAEALARAQRDGPCHEGSPTRLGIEDRARLAGAKVLAERQERLLAQPPPYAASPRQAWFARRAHVPLADSAGEIAAEALAPYPPGVPVVWPGETLTSEAVDLLTAVLKAGGAVHGVIFGPAGGSGEAGSGEAEVAVYRGEDF